MANTLQIAAILTLLALPACHAQIMPLLPEPTPLAVRADLPLDVVTKMAGARDPLPVKGTSWQFSELEHAMGKTVVSAAAPWAEAHRGARERGWQMQVELIKSEASVNDGLMQANLGVRATLKAVVGQQFLAQTQAFCTASGPVKTETEARNVLWRCMGAVSRNLAGWLDGVQP